MLSCLWILPQKSQIDTKHAKVKQRFNNIAVDSVIGKPKIKDICNFYFE